MENDRYRKEGLDLKRIVLCIANKLWIPAAGVIAGAVLGVMLYLVSHVLFAPQREYESVGKFYLNFNCEPEDYNQLAYNGYTWNDLMAADPILNRTMEGLPKDITRETVTASTKAEILSDIRLLTVTITTHDRELTGEIMEAAKNSLVQLGETDELFNGIEVYGISDSKLVVWDNRPVTAAAVGGILFLFLSVMFLFIYYVLDDSVYVESDAEKKYGMWALGTLPADGTGDDLLLKEELRANYICMCSNQKEIALLSGDESRESREEACAAAHWIEKLLQEEDKAEWNMTYIDHEMTLDSYEQMREMGGVIVAVRFAGGNGRAVERTINNLRKQNCPIIGIIITGADRKFLRKYYTCRKKGKQ